MILARWITSNDRAVSKWLANPYHVHQRLMMAYENEERILFRIESSKESNWILVQSQRPPEWQKAFIDFKAFDGPPEIKELNPILKSGMGLRFKLLANPCVKRDGKRLGLFKESDQIAWLDRKIQAGGGDLIDCLPLTIGMVTSYKDSQNKDEKQTHFGVLYEGVLKVINPSDFNQLIINGIGPAKGFGFGLLSLAR
ncbi:MAG: type I-E CRISPR-associated protein Cas6/Cse3/CasE [Anaerolineaceae bacterium]|nr:type I-E CRISPR-associated protein Cas6/Cse3/CasE [Anaerolineaceae bacterium]